MRHYRKWRLLLTKMAENVRKTNYANEELASLACFSCKCDQGGKNKSKLDDFLNLVYAHQGSIFHAIKARGTYIFRLLPATLSKRSKQAVHA